MKNNGSLFHYKDNIFFGRRRDNSVRILQFKEPGALEWIGGYPTNADDDFSRSNYVPLIDITIPADSWASIIASVSEGGESDYRFFAAKAWHDSEGEVEIIPKRKLATAREALEAVIDRFGGMQYPPECLDKVREALTALTEAGEGEKGKK